MFSQIAVFCGDYTDDYTDDYTMINSHSGNIFSREAVRGVGDQHAGLPHRAVPHHNTPVKNNILKLQERIWKKVPHHDAKEVPNTGKWPQRYNV